MNSFMEDYVKYWFKSVWQLITDKGWDVWWDRLLALTILFAMGGYTYLSRIRDLSPSEKPLALVIFFFFMSAFLLWYLPLHYVHKKHRWEGMISHEEQKRIDKITEERDAGPKRY